MMVSYHPLAIPIAFDMKNTTGDVNTTNVIFIYSVNIKGACRWLITSVQNQYIVCSFMNE